MRAAIIIALLSFAVTVAACSDSGSGVTQQDDADTSSADGSATADAGDADATEEDAPDAPPADEGADDAAKGDTEDDVADAADTADAVPGPLPELATQAPYAVPTDPLAGSGVTSCATYQAQRCDGGRQQACAIYDVGASAWVDTPDPMLHRAFLFDRWRDLYNSPDGQAIDRDFVGEVRPGTPEAEWGALERLAGYFGTGDGGIWTGWSTVASVLRYVVTGTEADYQRMEQQVRDMVRMYDVTGIPGYLCRYHYLRVPADAPVHPEIILRWEGRDDPGHHHRRVPDPAAVPGAPAAYTEGYADADGKVWSGTPMWQGRPSIDQNTGPMTSLPMAWGLLRDQELKDRIAHHLTCYLKRLQRIELINLQQNPALLESLISYFSVGELQFDEGDLDLTKLDRIVGYVHRQINTLNEDSYPTTCPDTVQLEPWRVLDATDPGFVPALLQLVNDMDVADERPNTIDHYYFPSIRGGDAMHMMHLATIAYHFTGDDMYREFLHRELIGAIETVAVAQTAGAFNLPAYCKKFFGDQITFGPWWAFLQLLGEGDLKVAMEEAFHSEMWAKLVRVAKNVDFNIMYAGAVRSEIAVDRDEALAVALEMLPTMGGNGGALMGDPFAREWLDDPRRTYSVTAEQALAAAGEGVTAVCPTEAEVATCTAEITVLGATFPSFNGWSTRPCSGSEYECPVGEENQCTGAKASEALPLPVRPSTDYLWQRDPFTLDRRYAPEGRRQFAGSDYSVPYWNARHYGFVTAGAGQVLAWRDVGACGAAADQCPAEQAQPGGACTGTATCEWGEECCCGECHPSFRCTCSDGTWACLNTDACFIAGCPCGSADDCDDSGQICLAPGHRLPCGACQQATDECTTDEDCGHFSSFRICETTSEGCLCEPAKQCVLGCTRDSDCAAGEACGETGRCEPAACAADSDCPATHSCASGTCGRSACRADSDCRDNTSCVNGACYPTRGTCSFIPP